ncbi:MAG: LamG-like jellyroll fold domain-containing protein, partial [Planctomycetota bacterium]|nr:LamG-like jellyroll fold domain-containing protein [Planctomycetota bacterium]
AAFASNAFSVAHRNCISYNSCTHEMGHNMGCKHDRANAGSSALYSYSYGYRTSGSPVYRSLMAYAPGTRVSRWSGPSVVYSGQTMGTATEDNARSLNNVKSIVGDWVGGCASSAACELVYYDFNTGRGATAVNQATGTDTAMTGTDPWAHPARYGPSMLKGQPSTSTAWVESEFKGPITGDLSIHWWMKERAPVGTGLSYLLGGLGSFRGFTNGVAGKEFWLRAWGGADLKLPTVGADLQTRAQGANGVCVTLTIDGTANVAQWYIDGAAHGAAITTTTGANVAAVANGFRVGKHTSDSSSSRYDLDEFRMVNRVATTDEIAMWCAGPNSLYFHFDRGREDVAVNYGNPVPGALVTGGLASAWQSPGRYGSSMLAGSNNSSAAEYNYCDTGFAGPIHGGVTIAWWMGDANPNSTATFSYLWGGIGSFRCFTGGAAGTGLWFRGNGATDIKYTGDIQAAAKAKGGVHVAVAVDAVGLTAQWYINGVATGAAQAIPNAIATAAAGSFNIGKHTSNTNGSRYHLDEFRLENRCATPAEIKAWSQSSTAGYGPLGTQCGLATGALGGPPTVGNSDYAHTIAAATPASASCLFVVGVIPTASFDMGFVFGSLAGCRWYPAFDVQVAVPAAGGSVIIPGGVPNNPALAGLHITSQVLGVQGGTILQSNAIDHAIEIN